MQPVLPDDNPQQKPASPRVPRLVTPRRRVSLGSFGRLLSLSHCLLLERRFDRVETKHERGIGSLIVRKTMAGRVVVP